MVELAPEELPLLCAIPAKKRAELLANAIQHSVAAGTVLFEQGEIPNFQLVVLAGSIQLLGQSSERREVLIEAVRGPDLIIPAAVVSGAPYLMQARAPEPARLLLIHAGVFRESVASRRWRRR
ncbi:CRP/FNR family transcriptional regulator, transcriptional activator FtrB [Faunimonas pinastri]|uniref:CRP/FNR family transcriptional regulator, transcriptional activator FtrB n=1 Tax=Faunimonas pinastri TaxID=1855383 RepID=A0A1H9IIC7_9HYPH|nr:cyclic nucleotide-binding domain-containing protein [Faunimonas pinastri]SEQ74360.1 CRP/FNR family transcriptional regulator, transcriptional activator FtrB [Faunimonas pinastri]